MRRQWRSWNQKSPSWWISCIFRYLKSCIQWGFFFCLLNEAGPIDRPNVGFFAAHSNWPFLWRSPSSVSHRAQERLCFRGLPADSGEVHQHVCRARWAEEHEMQRQKWSLCLQTVFWNTEGSDMLVYCKYPVIKTNARWQQCSVFYARRKWDWNQFWFYLLSCCSQYQGYILVMFLQYVVDLLYCLINWLNVSFAQSCPVSQKNVWAFIHPGVSESLHVPGKPQQNHSG